MMIPVSTPMCMGEISQGPGSRTIGNQWLLRQGESGISRVSSLTQCLIPSSQPYTYKHMSLSNDIKKKKRGCEFYGNWGGTGGIAGEKKME